MKKLSFGILFSLLLLPLISANSIIFPKISRLFEVKTIIGIIIIETILFWLLSNKSFKIKTGFWKSLLIVAISNIIIPFIVRYTFTYSILLYFILISFFLSVIIEWGVYLLFFLKQKEVKTKLFYLSTIINAISYILVGVYLFL